MMTSARHIRTFYLATALLATIGCAHVDRMGTRLESMLGKPLENPGKLEYEGKLETTHEVGAMTSIQFQDSKIFDVYSAPPELRYGDVVRIYKTATGHEARLRKAGNN